ncbi:4'-phosphopantetheinyl transferase family protein [Aquimarina algicola]|uniref:4'-phosphopantetheinyl transferase superfamily protein n=1 Tax=Aquimarina algicola TaxID=2589995 RepID=A0A504JME1_9FLAO|nr:4'-phosphopantetheinyl transferase superfamily protein [Aquimarina algicola]TPN87580.1 4'-phosphopantetheinyl transferase superfamily protein [Aquimarina algicola]
MPLYKTITPNNTTTVLIWKINESYEDLCEGITLTEYCQNRVDNMKSEMHRKGFMSVRHLLAIFGYTDHDLYYDEFGKPHLKDGNQISITHSYEFVGVIVSDKPVGIDIEKQREKINKIAHKFTNQGENEYMHDLNLDETRALTIIWGAKESLYKLYATAGLSFKDHIYISQFSLKIPIIYGAIFYQEKKSEYEMSFVEFEGFTCVYVLPAS